MRSRWLLLLIPLAFVAGIGAGVLGLLWATGGVSTPSRDTSDVVPTLALDAPTPTPGELAAISTQLAELNAKVDVVSTQVSAGGGQAATDQAATPPPDSDESAAEGDSTEGDSTEGDSTEGDSTEGDSTEGDSTEGDSASVPERALYRITEDESEARFIIDEVLAGEPTRVVGTTPRLAGDVIINFSDPAASQIGQIAINVRTLRTDQEFRDQAIRGQILRSAQDEFEFVTFAPTAFSGLPSTPVGVGETLNFEITGDLTVRGETRTVTFNAEVVVTSEDRITGFARTNILYPDFGITINAPPTVTDISDEVILEIDFVALRVEEVE